MLFSIIFQASVFLHRIGGAEALETHVTISSKYGPHIISNSYWCAQMLRIVRLKSNQHFICGSDGVKVQSIFRVPLDTEVTNQQLRDKIIGDVQVS